MKITIICFGNLILTGHIGTVMHIYRLARDRLVRNELETIFWTVQDLDFLTANQNSKLICDLGYALMMLIFVWFCTLRVGVGRPRFRNRSDEEPTLIRPRGQYFILVILFRSSCLFKRHMISLFLPWTLMHLWQSWNCQSWTTTLSNIYI